MDFEMTVNPMDELIDALRYCADEDKICTRQQNCGYYGKGFFCQDVLMRDAADAIEQLQAQVPAWINVEERLPEFHEEVLVYAIGKEDAFTPVMAVSEIYIFKLLPFSNGTIEWRNPWDYFNKNYKVTHWMPLPKAPHLT